MTAPLVPEDIDLRGLPWMRLDTARLLDSDLFALSTGDEFKAAVALWCKAWGQLPAGSLPDDDRILAHLSGAGARWKRLRAMALRGWILCDDGRLYHPVVAEQVIAAWEERKKHRAQIDAQALRKQKERAERADMFERLKAAGHTPDWNTPTGTLRDMCRDLSHGPSPEGHAACHGDSHGLDGTGRDGKAISPPDSPPERTRDARAPAALVGVFEGHPEPGQQAPNPVAPFAVALNRAGYRCTAMNPELVAYQRAGGTVEHLLAVAALPRCEGKPASWVAKAAIDELTRSSSPVTTTNGAAHAAHRQPLPGLADRHRPRRNDPPDAINGEAVRIDA